MTQNDHARVNWIANAIYCHVMWKGTREKAIELALKLMKDLGL